ncbi:MAG: response regulator [Candidatus Marinimicrobia bacterium]|nr:response regulator [Candidatus Neomarinimicrobiota bacterium]
MSLLKKSHVYVVDDDTSTLLAVKYLLEEYGAIVKTNASSTVALAEIIDEKPDLVILDLMMPGLDGLEMCRLLREEENLDKLKIIIFSGKTYEYDQQRAFSFGADGYITKPLIDESFIDKVQEIIEEKIEVCYWGVRGTLPVPGEGSLKYGGNTICASIKFPRDNLFILDAGTGIKQLSDHLMSQKRTALHAKILISHPHWDHINALPFFVPLYVPGNEFEVFGASHGDVTMRELISAQMDGVYFPIRIKEFAARTYFRDLREETFMINDIKVKTMLLSHPGTCLGYRMEYDNRSICYITDNELFPEESPDYNPNYLENLTAFVHSTDILITDTTYSDEEYKQKSKWGHSAVSQVVKLAHAAQVKELHMIHHDPDQTDHDIDRKLETAQNLLMGMNSKTRCLAPREHQTFKVL